MRAHLSLLCVRLDLLFALLCVPAVHGGGVACRLDLPDIYLT